MTLSSVQIGLNPHESKYTLTYGAGLILVLVGPSFLLKYEQYAVQQVGSLFVFGLISFLTFIVLSKLTHTQINIIKVSRAQQPSPIMHRSLYSAVPAPMRPIIRKRRLARLRIAPPNVNRVADDQRNRAEMDLACASIRVGKAYLRSVPGIPQVQDYYIVRVDCRQDSGQEKHMNPVVMWDLSASIREFYRLREKLAIEVQKKHRNVSIATLGTESYSFMQSKLNNDVLAKRREVLQAFLTDIQQDFGQTQAFRQFCQAF